jgi:type II secretion system protein N
MTTVRLTLVAVAVFAMALILGLMAYFPGESLARYISLQAERSLGLPVKLSPIQVGLTGLTADSLEIRMGESKPFVLRNVHAPWTWRWVTEFPLSARLGSEGIIELGWGWAGMVSVTGKSIAVQDLPLAMLPKDTRIQGRLDVIANAGPIAMRPAGFREIPQGRLEVKLEGFEAANLQIAGVSLPPIRFDSAEARLGLGRTVQLEGATFRGDAQGTASGTIVPNLDRLTDSRLSLNVSLQVQRAWMDRLGDLRPLAEGFLPGGRLEGAVEGTVGAPILNRNAKRS